MALQLPAEFPLGLVFVVGKVERLGTAENGRGPREFILSESGHNLRCHLSERTASEVNLNDGDLVRAGGHLAFDPSMAGYYLLARDVEVLEEYQPVTNLLADVTKDTSEVIAATTLAPATLPPWVEELAPPEIRAELERQRAKAVEPISDPADGWEVFVEAEAGMNYLAEEPALAGLSDDLIDFLSEAMDSTEDVELTPELLAEFSPDHEYHAPHLTEQDLEALHDLEAALVMTVIRENGGTGVKETEQQTQDLTSTQPPQGQATEETIAVASEPRPKSKSTVKKAPTAKSNATDIPWYVVVLILALTLFFVFVLVLIILFPDGLSLPFTLPNFVTISLINY
jgi:hypothetical protein